MRVYAAVIALLGWVALVVQFPLAVAASRANGMSMLGAVTTYFSYFTILTNLLVASGLSCILLMPGSNLGRFFDRPMVKAGLALYIGVVGAVYLLVLRELWNPQGWQKLADVFLHEAIPVLYVAYWLFIGSKMRLRWRSVATWLAYPAVYLLYTLVRGEVVGWYPYPFMDVAALGYGRVSLNSLGMLGVFVGTGAAMVAWSRRTGRGPDQSAVTSG